MRNMRSLANSALALGALLIFAAPTLAQTSAPSAPAPRRPHLMQDLNLTPAQKMKMQAIIKDARAKNMALRANTALTPAQKKAQHQAIAKNAMTQMSAILTPAQRAKLKAARAANSQRRIAP